MNDAELYNRVIHVEVAKPHRGHAGLDPTLPGMSPPLPFTHCFVDVLTWGWVVWQQEEWIKANVNKDDEGMGRSDPDAMQELEMAQKS